MGLSSDLLKEEWEYVGKGSANVVFAYSGEKPELTNKVMRIRLDNTDVSAEEVYNYLRSSRFNELRNYMVSTQLIPVEKIFLEQFQSYINEKRLPLLIDLKEKHVLVMDNIYSYPFSQYKCIELSKYHVFYVHDGGDDILFEFKPKWLYTLPSHHLNCRNCLTAMKKSQAFVCCHMKLLDKPLGVERWCNEIQSALNERGFGALNIQNGLEECLISNYNVVKTLYSLQNSINIHQKLIALSSQDDVDESLAFNMTLRDVSMFINITTKAIHIVDLDKKPIKKWETWKSQEMLFTNQYEEELNLNCGFKANR